MDSFSVHKDVYDALEEAAENLQKARDIPTMLTVQLSMLFTVNTSLLNATVHLSQQIEYLTGMLYTLSKGKENLH